MRKNIFFHLKILQKIAVLYSIQVLTEEISRSCISDFLVRIRLKMVKNDQKHVQYVPVNILLKF